MKEPSSELLDNNKLNNPGVVDNGLDRKNGDNKLITNDYDITSRKLSTSNTNNSITTPTTNKIIELKKTDNNDEKKQPDGSGNTLKTSEEDDKRKSTGSISSLKKLWEAKEGTNNEQMMQQLSPKLGIKNPSNNNKQAIADDDNEEHQQHNLKKPAVPIKPTKLVSIYATPIQVKLPPPPSAQIIDSNISTANTSATTTTTATTPITTTTTQINRDGILDLLTLLESSLKIPVNSISASQWLQLSDKLNILQNSCVAFADKESMPPHSKFQFRELVSRIECQSRCLRSAGSKNFNENEKLVLEVGQSLKQISNALHR